MKKTAKRTIAAMSAAAMLLCGAATVNAQEVDMSVVLPAVGSFIESGSPDHGYIVVKMNVGKNAEMIASGDDSIHFYKNDAAIVLAADGSPLSLEDIKEGDIITCYVDASAPMTLQLPITYTPAVIVVGDEVGQKIAVFDEDGLSDDGELIINYDLSTPYYSRTREATFISGKALVLYDMMTMSIPAQTNPLAIVKLVDDEKLVVIPKSEAPEARVPDLSGVKTIVAGENTVNHIPVTVNGVQMLPVRAVAEALGYEVTWVGETQSVNVGFASFSIEEDGYAFARRAPQSLGQAPVLIALPTEQYATTYVPAAFFTEVLGHSMTVDGDALIISANDEPMFIPPLAPGEFVIPVE